MPVRIKELNPKKKMPLPKPKPRHANPKHPMNTEKTRPMASKAADKKRSRRGGSLERQPGGSFGVRKAAPSTGMAGGGKLKMVEKGGKKVPFFAADGVGKMAKGGPVKVKSGDTLSQIAKSKGVTLKALMAANPSIRNANQIRVGQSIKMPDSRAGKGTPMSKNPYEGMTKSSMKALADDTAANRARLRGAKASKARTAKSPDVAKKRATTTTRLNQLGETNRRQRAAEASAPKLQKKAASKLAKQDTNRIASTPASKLTETRMARLAKTNRANRRMGGGSMKKVQGYKSGGVVRGAGAATRGKGFNRAG